MTATQNFTCSGRLASSVLLSLALTSAFAASAFAGSALGSAVQHPIDESGIRGKILIMDTGSPDNGLVVTGRATGLDPSATFVSLFYDSLAVPGGPDACLPSGPALTSTQMFIGVWQVEPDGTGTLFAQKTGESYAPIGEIGAVSIRDVQGPIPQGAILVSCGKVRSAAFLKKATRTRR